MTENLGAVIEVLRRLRPGCVQPGGTDLGAGLDAALEAMGNEEHAGGQSIVVLSDGEDLADRWKPRLDRLLQREVVVYAVTIGDAEHGHTVPVRPRSRPRRRPADGLSGEGRRIPTIRRVPPGDRRADQGPGDSPGARLGRPELAVPQADRAVGSPPRPGPPGRRHGRAVPAVPGRRAVVPVRRLLAAGSRLVVAVALAHGLGLGLDLVMAVDVDRRAGRRRKAEAIARAAPGPRRRRAGCRGRTAAGFPAGKAGSYGDGPDTEVGSRGAGVRKTGLGEGVHRGGRPPTGTIAWRRR